MRIEIRMLGNHEQALLSNVAPDVFDNPVEANWCTEFVASNRHHLAVALDGDLVIGMASAVHYLHPDKAPELWINEVGVAASHHRKGIGKKLMNELLRHGQSMGCTEAWVLTEEDNVAARALYKSAAGKEEAERPVYITFKLNEVA